jgi:hypothetical protein
MVQVRSLLLIFRDNIIGLIFTGPRRMPKQITVWLYRDSVTGDWQAPKVMGANWVVGLPFLRICHWSLCPYTFTYWPDLAFFLDCLALDGGPDILSWNVDKKLPTNAAQHPRRPSTATELWQQPKILQVLHLFVVVIIIIIILKTSQLHVTESFLRNQQFLS